MDEQQIRDDERLKVLKELRAAVLDEQRRVCPDAKPESPVRCMVQVVTAAYHRERRRQGVPVQTPQQGSNSSRKVRAQGYWIRIRQAVTRQELASVMDAAEADDAVTARLLGCAMTRLVEIDKLEAGR